MTLDKNKVLRVFIIFKNKKKKTREKKEKERKKEEEEEEEEEETLGTFDLECYQTRSSTTYYN